MTSIYLVPIIVVNKWKEGCSMKSASRQSLIYEYIKKCNEVSSSNIAQYFNISPVTVRRYLDKLEANGLIYRKYGKAIIIDKSKAEFSFHSRLLANKPYKSKIASLALPYVRNISTAFFDASTTALEVLKLLPKTHSMTIYASNTAIIDYLHDYTNINLFILGGFLSKIDETTLDSETTIHIARQIYVDAAFISCGGFSSNGFFDNATSGIEVKRVMLQNSEHNFLLADHTKYNSNGIFLVDTWTPINTLICDSSFDKKTELLLAKRNIDVIY